jgi:hypothetical protein
MTVFDQQQIHEGIGRCGVSDGAIAEEIDGLEPCAA